MIATLSQMCLDAPVGDRVTAGHCLPPASRASVQCVGGTDALLASRLAAGDEHALAEVFDGLARSVFGSAVRVLGDNGAAQDVVQDVFVELWTHPDRYDPAAGTLRTYLTVLARHRAVDLVRSELRRIARQEREFRLAPVPSAECVSHEVLAAETASLVWAAVELLPAGPDPGPEVALYGLRLSVRALLVVRAFELWTHENDIRRAVGWPASVPDASTLSLMTDLAARLLPYAASQAGLREPVDVHLVLTGPGGGTWDITAGQGSGAPAAVMIVTGAVEFCRLAANRITPAELDAWVTGDPGRAAEVLAAACMLALD